MGRTAHHQRNKFDTREFPAGYAMYWRSRPLIPVREHTVYGLRYSAAELAAAEEEGRRPVPEKVRRRAQWWTYTGAYTPSSSRSFWADKHERANRRYVKQNLEAGRRLAGDAQLRRFERAAKRPRRMLYDIW